MYRLKRTCFEKGAQSLKYKGATCANFPGNQPPIYTQHKLETSFSLAIFTVQSCYPLESVDFAYDMLSVQEIKSAFRRRKNPDRVYLYEERRSHSFFRRFLNKFGIKQRDRKYHPEKFQFSDVSSVSIRAKTSHPRAVQSRVNDSDPAVFEEDLDIEIIDLEVEVPIDETVGEQEEPLPLIIGFEYPEEEMPVWFHLGYGCDPPELEFSWLRFFGFKSDHFV